MEPAEVPTDRDALKRALRSARPTPPAEVVRRGLALFNLEYPGELHASLHVFLRHVETGEICGGLLGRTGRGALYIEHFWIAEAQRRGGQGSRLLARAESEAIDRGCRFAFVDTYDFQSPGFYERCGYVEFAQLGEFTGGYVRHYYRKSLAPQSALLDDESS